MQKENRLQVLTLDELYQIEIESRDYLISPWLREGESALLYAPTGVGKSMLAMTIGLAIAGGGSVLGWEAAKPLRVLFVDGEMYLSDLKERAQLLTMAISDINIEKANKNFHILSRQHQKTGTIFPDMNTKEGQSSLLNYAKGTVSEEMGHGPSKFDLVILDNLSTLATIDDENSASAFNDFIRLLMDLKQEGIACILVHHSGKNGEQSKSSFRGSSKLATTFEVLIGLDKLSTGIELKGTAFKLHWDKFRNRPNSALREIEVRLVLNEETGFPAWVVEGEKENQLQTMVNMVQSRQYTTQKELANALHISQATLTDRKKKALELRLIMNQDWDQCFKDAQSIAEESEERFEDYFPADQTAAIDNIHPAAMF